MAYLEDLSGYEAKLQEFRDSIKDQLPALRNDFLRQDISLLKFLVARNFDVNKAEELFRKYIKWRQKFDMNKILQVTYPEVIVTSFPYYYSGFDKRGYPVLIEPPARWKIRVGFKSQQNIADMRSYTRQAFENLLDILKHVSEVNQRPIYQYTTIFDMEGFDYTQFMSTEVIRESKDMVVEYFDNYVELPCAIRIVNAPKLFQMIWAIVEPLLSGRTKSKIEIYGTNKEHWKPKLLDWIDADNLPARFGGAVTSCFDYRMEYGINAFPKIVILPQDSFQQVSIPARQKHLVSFDLEIGDELAWNFSTVDCDIGFRVDRDGLNESVFDSCRVDSHKFVQKGHFVCRDKGHYTLTFDNSYSKFKPKTLCYATQHLKIPTGLDNEAVIKMPGRSPA